MRIRDWSSDVCSSDLAALRLHAQGQRLFLCRRQVALIGVDVVEGVAFVAVEAGRRGIVGAPAVPFRIPPDAAQPGGGFLRREAGAVDRRSGGNGRSEEHTTELQSLMRISYAVFCVKKQNKREHKQE